jgi:hypothetical protein
VPREKITYKLDDRLKPAIARLAKRRGCSSASMVEGIIFDALQLSGDLDSKADRLPETRGGRRVKQKEEETDRG